MTDYTKTIAWDRGVREAIAARELVEPEPCLAGGSHELMPCGHCVHATNHAHGCPDLTEWN